MAEATLYNEEKYKKLLEEVWCLLKGIGYKKTGSTFRIHERENSGVINFQRSKDSLNGIKFTINAGIFSKLLWKFFHDELLKAPNVWNCQWHARVGFLIPQKVDTWWTINSALDIEHLINDIKRIVSEK